MIESTPNSSEQQPSTEQKIKEAAQRVFTRKGYAATRTRDIAEESGYNLALINYYFRSKEKLFDIIMMEQIERFVHSVAQMLDDKNTSLQQKVEQLVAHYIGMLVETPGLAFFIMNEINSDPAKLFSRIQTMAPPLHFVEQWFAHHAGKGNSLSYPLHAFINMVSMTVFPFVAAPVIKMKLGCSEEQFTAMMQERKKLIPIWVMNIMNQG